MEARIPELDPNEVRHHDGVKESVWVPMETIGVFQKWTQYWLQREVEKLQYGDAASIAVNMYPCIQNTQSKWKIFGREKSPETTFGTRSAPLGEKGCELQIQTLAPSHAKGFLVWSTSEGYVLDRDSVAQLFPGNEAITQHGSVWVVHQKRLTDDERLDLKIKALDKKRAEEERQQFHITTDLVTGEEIRTLPVSTVDMQTGNFVYGTLKAMVDAEIPEGETRDIRQPIEVCHRNGPVKGLKNLLSPEDVQSLDRASREVIARVYKELVRSLLADEVDTMCKNMDSAMEEHAAPYVDKIRNVHARESVQRALDTWRTNSSNPHRNLYLRSKRTSTPEDPHPGRAFPVPMYRQNPDYFSVTKMDSGIGADNVGAGYDAAMGIVVFPQKATYSFFDVLNVIHEVTHKNQHTDAVGRDGDLEENHERYTKPVNDAGGEGNGILEEECEAWSNMIELLFARIGFGDHSPESILESFGMYNAPLAVKKEVMQILQYSKVYFSGGGRKANGEYPQEFVDLIKNEYTRLGLNVFTLDENGFPVLLPQSDNK